MPRASKLGLNLVCTASQLQPQLLIEGDKSAADLGTAAHWVLTGMIAGERTYEDIRQAAIIHRVDEKELAPLVHAGLQCWDRVQDFFPCPMVEYALDNADDGDLVPLTGHIDIGAIVHPRVHVLDFKTGFLDADHTDQLKTYCLLMMRKFGLAGAYGCVVRVREKIVDGVEYTRDELESWWLKAQQDLARDAVYTPGRHCQYCPRAFECPARAAVLRTSVQAILADDWGQDILEPARKQEAMAVLFQQIKEIEKLSKLATDMIRTEVQINGPIPIGNGQEIHIRVEERNEIDPAKGRPVLLDVLTQAQFDACTSIAKGKVEKEISANAPKGKKKHAVAGVMDRLAAAGALSVSYIEKLESGKQVSQLSAEELALTSSDPSQLIPSME